MYPETNLWAGVTLPFAAGRLTMGAVQCGKEQRELLERSSLASASAGDAQLGPNTCAGALSYC
eukprot:gene11358-7349_t